MGSLGSGRKYSPGEVKPTVENQIAINILDLNKKGFLKAGIISMKIYSMNLIETGWIVITAAAESLRLDYFYNGTFRQQTIQMTSTSPNYGGQRKYLLCPKCNSKREMLYHGKNGKFACRVCHGLVYRSSQLNPHLRHGHRADKFLERLGGIDFIFDKKNHFGCGIKLFLSFKIDSSNIEKNHVIFLLNMPIIY